MRSCTSWLHVLFVLSFAVGACGGQPDTHARGRGPAGAPIEIGDEESDVDEHAWDEEDEAEDVEDADDDECAEPAPGCGCDTPGEWADCGTVYSKVGNQIVCGPGRMVCAGDTWGECILNYAGH